MVSLPNSPRMALKLLLAVTTAVGLLTVAACGADADTTSAGDVANAPLEVSASFYPLAYLATEIGGSLVTVTSLTKPGAEPHDLELSPGDVAAVSEADLVVYLAGFQPSVDEAVTQADQQHVFDAADSAELSRTFTPIEDGEEHDDEAGAVDPHFWLDISRFTNVAETLSERLASIDPEHARTYSANLERLVDELQEVDDEYRSSLVDCDPSLVTSHNAFGYLAERFGFEQVGITGLTPEDEPSAASLAAVSDFVRDNEVGTIYFETLVDPSIAETVASETGARTAVLDPIEGLTDESAGDDYLEVMRSNLATLVTGQSCG